jgi:hypothetical protein
MHSLSLHPSSVRDTPADLEAEAARRAAALAARRAELTSLQDDLREFKARYAQAVGSRLAELAEVEKAIKEAEGRLLGVAAEAEEEEPDADFYGEAGEAPAGKSLRRLFWSVAKMFHPDHASDEGEARRRHTVMAEASRAYREGDVESLHTLLGDEGLQSFCATTRGGDDEAEDLGARVLTLELELRTVEFGIKRIRQDTLYRLKLEVDEEAARGRDALSLSADRIDRQIAKARRRLAHLS